LKAEKGTRGPGESETLEVGLAEPWTYELKGAKGKTGIWVKSALSKDREERKRPDLVRKSWQGAQGWADREKKSAFEQGPTESK